MWCNQFDLGGVETALQLVKVFKQSVPAVLNCTLYTLLIVVLQGRRGAIVRRTKKKPKGILESSAF